MRVMLVDDSTLFREGLALLLAEAGVEVVDQARTADEALVRIERDQPDVVILDIRMPPTHTDEGLVAARALKQRWPGLGVLVLSAFIEPASAARLLHGSTGGVGYLLKDRVDDVETLRDALLRIGRGEPVIDPEIVRGLMHRRRRSAVLDGLSEREREVLRLMAEGRSNAGIAELVALAPKTVEAHVNRIFGKLGLLRSGEPASARENRRVLAVLAWLRANPPPLG